MSKFINVEYNTSSEGYGRDKTEFIKENIYVNIDHIVSYHRTSNNLTIMDGGGSYSLSLTDKGDAEFLDAIGEEPSDV